MASSDVMLAILHVLGIFVCDLLKSRRRLQAENLFLRPSTQYCIAAGVASALYR
jgi:hypothetical protein